MHVCRFSVKLLTNVQKNIAQYYNWNKYILPWPTQTYVAPGRSCMHAPLSFIHPQYGSLEAMQALNRGNMYKSFCKSFVITTSVSVSTCQCMCCRGSDTEEYVLFAFAMTFTSSQRHSYQTVWKCYIEGTALLVQLHTHNSLVLHPIIAAPNLDEWVE